MERLKLYLVRRWLHLVPLQELETYTGDRRVRESMNAAYKKLTTTMIDTFYKENQ